jgi:flagellar biosynthetic protein FlhB
MNNDLGERTEEATPRRLRDARTAGKVASSRDLGSAIALLLGTLAIWVAASMLFQQGRVLVIDGVSIDTFGYALDPDGLWDVMGGFGVGVLNILVPLLAVFVLAALFSQFVQIGWLFTVKPLQPQPERLNPIHGARRLFGVGGIVRVSLDVMKILVVLSVAVLTVVSYQSKLIVLPYLEVGQVATVIGHALLDLSLRVAGVLLLLGMLDLLYQKWKYRQDMKMTRQQVKDDLKDAEGDPEYKRRRMRMMQQLAMQRIATTVPTANVIVTNPERLAVAICYDASTMAAPLVVAKGADAMAMRICHIASQHGVPIVERKPLARALYAQVDVNQPIPYDLFKVVAELLAKSCPHEGRMAL